MNSLRRAGGGACLLVEVHARGDERFGRSEAEHVGELRHCEKGSVSICSYFACRRDARRIPRSTPWSAAAAWRNKMRNLGSVVRKKLCRRKSALGRR